MSRWFRMYNEALDDPKVQNLSPPDFKSWINLLLLACRFDGNLPTEDDIAFHLRISAPCAKRIVKTLISKGLIDPSGTDDSAGMPHGWHKRQYKSDVSTDRVKRFRNGERNVSSTVSVTAPETDTESETDTETEPFPNQEKDRVVSNTCAREENPFAVIKGGK